jgi:hypothetical protein
MFDIYLRDMSPIEQNVDLISLYGRYFRMHTEHLFDVFQLLHVRRETISVDQQMLHGWSMNDIVRLEQASNRRHDVNLQQIRLNLEHPQETRQRASSWRYISHMTNDKQRTWFNSSFSQKTPLIWRCSHMLRSTNNVDDDSAWFPGTTCNVNHFFCVLICPIAFSMNNCGNQHWSLWISLILIGTCSWTSCVFWSLVKFNLVNIICFSHHRAS